MTATRLNPLTLPLQDASLIEASAGTGKTYTLAALYLRLLLGLGHEAAYPRPLSVEEILVVTFTEAATEELRGRIRENIHRLRLACVRRSTDDTLLQALLDQITSPDEAARILLAAERQMDEAAVYTIHGFCQRMLSHNAIESGMLFQQNLVEDESMLRQQVCADFWRRHCYPLPYDIAVMVHEEWDGPQKLLAELLPYLQGEPPVMQNPPLTNETIVQRHHQIIAAIDGLKSQWRAAAGDLPDIMAASGVDRRSYSSKYLPTWLASIGEWAAEATRDYRFPKELERFCQSVLLAKSPKGPAPRHTLFDAVDAFFAQPLRLRDVIFVLALKEVRLGLELEKRRRAEMGFDDLLSGFDRALSNEGGEKLASAVRKKYPVAMIDEFQDTDPQQYRIFRRIYADQPDCGLLLIGDPKQAIYAFRGADIFTYMRARSEVVAHYTLDTNWRSAPGMVDAVNQLFRCLPSPFIFADIPFLPVESAEGNRERGLEIHGQRQAAMMIWLQAGDGVSLSDYQSIMARQCAATISNWLKAAHEGQACLIKPGGKRQPVQASDMTVLVRNRLEAALVRDALRELSIPAVYLSNRDSVFDAAEARDLLWILQAVLMPAQDNALRCAIACSLIGLDAAAIDKINNNEVLWDEWVEEFARYRLLWSRRGVLPMLRQLMSAHHTAENVLAGVNGERRLTDLLHLGELLQEASAQLENEHALVRWLALQIEKPDIQSDNQQLRLESDRHLVQIITVHKSKGLEFPLVFLPFAADYRAQKRPLYHDRDSYQSWLDLGASARSLALAEEERLAEDLRLLYVALTRSVYHCSIGVAPLFRGSRKKQGETDLHHSALGYLIQRAKPADAAALRRELEDLCHESRGSIRLAEVSDPDGQPWLAPESDKLVLSARLYPHRRQDHWRVTSYSGLQQHGAASVVMDLRPGLDIDAVGEQRQDGQAGLTPHTFPRGAAPGTFLHSLFEVSDFSRTLEMQWLTEHCSQHGIEAHWLPMLAQWLHTVITTRLNSDGITLANIDAGKKQVEMQFYLPIDAMVSAVQLDSLCKKYDPLSRSRPPLSFPQVRGMLKGFIDLVFCWQGRYYLLDYKSNWLGSDAAAYTQEAMRQAMASHSYDLQYQLYTLALHRYLRHRLPDYDYQRHFGGVFYLFLRGISAQYPDNGVFFYRPESQFIIELDALFSTNGTAVPADGID